MVRPRRALWCGREKGAAAVWVGETLQCALAWRARARHPARGRGAPWGGLGAVPRFVGLQSECRTWHSRRCSTVRGRPEGARGPSAPAPGPPDGAPPPSPLCPAPPRPESRPESRPVRARRARMVGGWGLACARPAAPGGGQRPGPSPVAPAGGQEQEQRRTQGRIELSSDSKAARSSAARPSPTCPAAAPSGRTSFALRLPSPPWPSP